MQLRIGISPGDLPKSAYDPPALPVGRQVDEGVGGRHHVGGDVGAQRRHELGLFIICTKRPSTHVPTPVYLFGGLGRICV